MRTLIFVFVTFGLLNVGVASDRSPIRHKDPKPKVEKKDKGETEDRTPVRFPVESETPSLQKKPVVDEGPPTLEKLAARIKDLEKRMGLPAGETVKRMKERIDHLEQKNRELSRQVETLRTEVRLKRR